MEFHAEAWNRVFPDGLSPDGRKIEKLFVTGNHDVAGWQYGIGFRVEKIYPDPEERAKHLLLGCDHEGLAIDFERENYARREAEFCAELLGHRHLFAFAKSSRCH